MFFLPFHSNSLIVLKAKQYARLSNEVKYKNQPSIQCRVCSTINISKNENKFLSTSPTTLILSTLVSEFWQRIQMWEIMFLAGGGGCWSVVENGASRVG